MQQAEIKMILALFVCDLGIIDFFGTVEWYRLVAVLSYCPHHGKYRRANDSKYFANAPLVWGTWLAVSSSTSEKTSNLWQLGWKEEVHDL